MSVGVADQPVEHDLIPQPGHVPDRVCGMPPQQVEHPGQVVFAGPFVLLRGRNPQRLGEILLMEPQRRGEAINDLARI